MFANRDAVLRAAVMRPRKRRQDHGQEVDASGSRAFGRGPRAPRADHRQPAEPPEARLASPHHPGARLGPRPGRDHAPDGHVEADGLALAGPLPRRGRRRASPGRHPPSGKEAGPRGEGEGRDRAGDVAAAGARPALDGAGAGEEAGDGRLHRARHPEGQRPPAAPGEDLQGLPRPEVRVQGARRRRPPRRPARPRGGPLGGRE